MIDFPLTRSNRLTLARAFARVPVVDISIACVVEDQMGKAYVDRFDDPTVFLVELGGFFDYFAGDVSSAAGVDLVQNLPVQHLLMAAAPGWFEAIRAAYGDRLIPVRRYSFTTGKLSLPHVTGLLNASPVRESIRRLDCTLVEQASEPFVSIGDFDGPEDFVRRGIGFGCWMDGQMVGGAYSSLVSGRSIEVSLFVHDDYRRRGIATALSAALLAWCLEHGVDPHWDAANEESCLLAQKLGYTLAGTYTAYYLE